MRPPLLPLLPLPHPMQVLALSLVLAVSACATPAPAGPAASAASAAAAIPLPAGATAPATATVPVAPCPADPRWDTPAQPRRIYANVWYVGSCAISAVLITSDQGHVLIDGVTESFAPRVLENIRSLGFEPGDVRYLLNSHEHIDHAGGLAALQRATGARVLAREPAASALEHGKADRGDPQFLSVPAFAPVPAVQRIQPGQTLRLGPLALTAHATPGHTPGGTSWTWRSCEGAGDCRDIAYADSLTAFSDEAYRYTDEAAHPGALAAFRRSLQTVAELPCDLLLTPHPGASQLFERLDPASGHPLAEAGACRAYAANAAAKLDEREVQERQPVERHSQERDSSGRESQGRESQGR